MPDAERVKQVRAEHAGNRGGGLRKGARADYYVGQILSILRTLRLSEHQALLVIEATLAQRDE